MNIAIYALVYLSLLWGCSGESMVSYMTTAGSIPLWALIISAVSVVLSVTSFAQSRKLTKSQQKTVTLQSVLGMIIKLEKEGYNLRKVLDEARPGSEDVALAVSENLELMKQGITAFRERYDLLYKKPYLSVDDISVTERRLNEYDHTLEISKLRYHTLLNSIKAANQ